LTVTVEGNKRDNYVNGRTFCPREADYLRAIERERPAALIGDDESALCACFRR